MDGSCRSVYDGWFPVGAGRAVLLSEPRAHGGELAALARLCPGLVLLLRPGLGVLLCQINGKKGDAANDGAGDHQTENRKHHTVHLAAFHTDSEIPAQQDDQDNTHEREQKLSDLLPETDPESHPFVFHKMEIKPLPNQWNSLTYNKMCFYPKLDDLVNNDKYKHNSGGYPSVFFLQFAFFYYNNLL